MAYPPKQFLLPYCLASPRVKGQNFADGRVEEIIVHQPKGHPDAPLSDADLLGKMTWLLEGLVPAHTPTQLLDLCSCLTDPEDVQQLIEMCNLTPTRALVS